MFFVSEAKIALCVVFFASNYGMHGYSMHKAYTYYKAYILSIRQSGFKRVFFLRQRDHFYPWYFFKAKMHFKLWDALIYRFVSRNKEVSMRQRGFVRADFFMCVFFWFPIMRYMNIQVHITYDD